MNKYHNFLDELNSVCRDMDNKFDMNSGGCLYCAYCVAKFLDKFRINYIVVMNMYEDSGLEDTPYHVSIKVKDTIINPSIYNDGYIKEYPSNILSHKGLKILHNRWSKYASDSYKKYHNSDVHKTIKKIFEKHERIL